MSRSGKNPLNMPGGASDNDFVSQGIITSNVAVSDEVAKRRQQNMGDSNIAKIGSTLVRGADPSANLHVRPWQCMMTYRKAPRAVVNARIKNGKSISMLRLPVFTSWNGIEVPTGYSQEDFEDEYEAVGFSADYYVFNELSQADTGLSAVVGGSFSTTNTSVHPWTPGQLIKWSAPPIDRQLLAQFVEKKRKLGAITPTHDSEYFPVVLEPFNFERDVVQVARRSISAVFRAASQPGAERSRLLDLSPVNAVGVKMSSTERFFKTKAHADLTTVLLAVSVLAQSGHITINNRPAAAAAGALAAQTLFGGAQRAAFADLAAQLGVLATQGANGPRNSPSYELMYRVLGRINAGFLDDGGSAVSTFSVANAMPKLDSSAESATALTTIAAEALFTAQQQGSKQAFEVYASSIHRASQRVVAKSISFVAPGHRGGVVLG